VQRGRQEINHQAFYCNSFQLKAPLLRRVSGYHVCAETVCI
jgi:hypothetical protein